MSDPFLVTNWDTDQTGAFWDTGLDWDSNIGPSLGDVTPYTSLITSEHNQQPDFMTMVGDVLQSYADLIYVLGSLPSAFDLDNAVGAQLDVIGQWVGVSQQVSVPLADVYFSWATPGLGWGQGNWKDPNDPSSGLVSLNDADYLTLIRAKIAANHWDGTIPGAYAAWDDLFGGTGTGILIQDYGDMTMAYALTGTPPTAVEQALYTSGLLNIKPAGVLVRAYLLPPANGKYFAWGVQNANMGGWGTGSWSGFPGGN
jgi:hypothetical protein